MTITCHSECFCWILFLVWKGFQPYTWAGQLQCFQSLIHISTIETHEISILASFTKQPSWYEMSSLTLIWFWNSPTGSSWSLAGLHSWAGWLSPAPSSCPAPRPLLPLAAPPLGSASSLSRLGRFSDRLRTVELRRRLVSGDRNPANRKESQRYFVLHVSTPGIVQADRAGLVRLDTYVWPGFLI